jgi:hypothetical protein
MLRSRKPHNLIGIVTEGDLLRLSESGTTMKRSRWLEFLLGPGKKLTSTFAPTAGASRT